MSKMYTVQSRLWLTEDGERLVPEGHPDAHLLYAAPGAIISAAEATRFGVHEIDNAPLAPVAAPVVLVDTTGGGGQPTDATFMPAPNPTRLNRMDEPAHATRQHGPAGPTDTRSPLDPVPAIADGLHPRRPADARDVATVRADAVDVLAVEDPPTLEADDAPSPRGRGRSR